jgi:hypothetical protein
MPSFLSLPHQINLNQEKKKDLKNSLFFFFLNSSFHFEFEVNVKINDIVLYCVDVIFLL